MLVTLDIFSGRPNPTWYVPRGQVREVADRFRAITARDIAPRAFAARAAAPPAPPHLGFRGFVIQPTEPGEVPEVAPVAMRVAAPETAPGGDELETARFLLSTAEAAVEPDLATVVSESIEHLESAAGADDGGPAAGGDLDQDGDSDVDDELVARLSAAMCRERLTPMVLPYWNTPFVQPYNNCYNYATNFVSGTLAQPGRRSGQIYSSFSCDHVLAAARRDGLLTECGRDVGVVALGIWPGFDFHWWRLHPGNAWAHKVGWWAPQTVDNANRVIAGDLTPATCDRGPYDQFCGYYFVPPWMWVA